MFHDKTGLIHLAEMMARRGIKHLIVSPGSRNAPIVTVFSQQKEFHCHTIVDERSAAFFALGMAQQLKEPVAITCTSGTAALNYATAIAEAFYQRIPLIVLTADRPVEWIDQGDGQTIQQNKLYGPHVRKSVQLPSSIHNSDELWYNDRLIAETLNAAVYPVPGPVHINVPFSEPLYGFDHKLITQPKEIKVAEVSMQLSDEAFIELEKQWKKSERKMILVGQMPPDDLLLQQLKKLAMDSSVVVLTETTSNVFDDIFVGCIDRNLSTMANPETYYPDLLLTIGGHIVSKRIKSFLRDSKVKYHWNVDLMDFQMDTYQHLTVAIPMKPTVFLDQLMTFSSTLKSEYNARWKELKVKAKLGHDAFLSICTYSDLKIFETILKFLPASYDVQLANSTPVRYSQLFDYPDLHRFDSNRGTSGIDGSVSTAAGAAFATHKPTVLITGDLGFFYDSNALWNKHLPVNLKIIVINNGGGGIFRFIDGPADTGLLEEFFEAQHQTSGEFIAKAFGLDYYTASNKDELNQQLASFFNPSKRASILEIKSPAHKSAETLKCYFKELSPKLG